MRSLLITIGSVLAVMGSIVWSINQMMPTSSPEGSELSKALFPTTNYLTTSLMPFVLIALILGTIMLIFGIMLPKPTVEVVKLKLAGPPARRAVEEPVEPTEPTAEPIGILSDVLVQEGWQQPPKPR